MVALPVWVAVGLEVGAGTVNIGVAVAIGVIVGGIGVGLDGTGVLVG